MDAMEATAAAAGAAADEDVTSLRTISESWRHSPRLASSFLFDFKNYEFIFECYVWFQPFEFPLMNFSLWIINH